MEGKVIVVTGAASGIGLETAKLLASKSCRLSLADVQEGPLKKAVSDITSAGGTAIGKVVDIRKRDQVDAWIKETVDAYGKIDGCANIAGVIGKEIGLKSIFEIEDEDWDFVMDVNIKGAQIPNMNEGGSIANAASICGQIGLPKNGAYCSSKHAVIGLTRVAAKELGPKNIRCNAICPGPIETPMIKQSADMKGGVETNFNSIVALQCRAHPKEVANLVEWLLSDGSSYVTGAVQSVDGGWFCRFYTRQAERALDR